MKVTKGEVVFSNFLPSPTPDNRPPHYHVVDFHGWCEFEGYFALTENRLSLILY